MRKFPWFLAALLALTGTVPAVAAEKIVTLGTAAVTGVYYPAGGAICRLVNRGRSEHGLRCVVEPTGGSIDNLESLRSGEVDMAVVQSDWFYNALRGKEVFAGEGANPKLRVLFSLHAEPFTVIARAGAHIKNFDDLKGKRVNIGAPGSGMRATMEELIKRKGWTHRSFAGLTELKPSEQGKALCAGKIDALIFAGGHPNAFTEQVTTACATHLVSVTGKDIDTLIANQPYYFHATIPAGMYPGTPDATETFGVKALVAVSADMDEAEAYQIVKAVFDNLDSFKTLHPVFATLNVEDMVHDAAAIGPLHPGADRYFREKGWVK